MKKCIYVLLIATVSLCSCKKGSYETSGSNVTAASLPAALKTSASFRRYMVYSTRLEVGILSDKYNLRNVNWAYIRKNNVNLHSMPELYAIYQKAGMENAQDYISTSLRATFTYHRLSDEFPVIKTISPIQVAKIVHKVYFEDMGVKKPDYAALAIQKNAIRMARNSKL